jgi:hypothetical protein
MKNIGAVDIGGLVTFGIYGTYGRYVNYRIVTAPFPRIEGAYNEGPYDGFIIDIYRTGSQGCKKVIQHAGLIIENIEHKGTDDYPGNKIRKKDNRLAEFFVLPSRHFGNGYSDKYRQGLGRDKVHKVIEKSVPGYPEPVARDKKKTEIFKPVPGAAEDTQVKTVILERQYKPGHGDVLQHKDKKHRRDGHKEQRPVFYKFPVEPIPSSGGLRLHRKNAPSLSNRLPYCMNYTTSSGILSMKFLEPGDTRCKKEVIQHLHMSASAPFGAVL